MRLRNQDDLRPTPIGESRSFNATSQSPSDFVLSKIRTEGAIGVREPATDIALETGMARHELWQYDRWRHGREHQLLSICGHGRIPTYLPPILAPFCRGAQGDVTFYRFLLATHASIL